MTLEPRAHQDREFRGFFVELVLQAHEPEHVTRIFVERDERHFVPVVEMGELIDLRGAELGNVRKKPKSQILGADVGQKIPVQRHVFGPRPTDQHALAARNRFVQFARAKVALVRHRRDKCPLR